MAELNLSHAQRSIIEAPIGCAAVVLASAGSGKTRVLTERVKYLLSCTKKEGVIAFTFTNAAAAELKTRLDISLESEERLWIGTIHSVAQRMLEQYGHTIGLPSVFHIFERDQDRMEVFIQSLREAGVNIDEYLNIDDEREQRNRERVLQNYMATFSIIKREMLNENEVSERFPSDQSVWRIFKDYNNALISSGGIDFDDILVFGHKLLLTQEWVASLYRAKYKHVCVDEAQDLNRIQYEFIKTFCGSSIKSLLLVGDPNQMIYGFNGSSAEFMTTQFNKDFQVNQYELSENYRSTKAIITAANKLKPNTQQSSQYALQGSFSIHSFENEALEAAGIIAAIKKIISMGTHPEIEGDLSLEKMVVIARNRFAFAALEDALRQENIPFYIRKGDKMADATSVFGRILDYGLRLKINPKDWIDAQKLKTLLGIKIELERTSLVTLDWFAKNVCQLIFLPSLQKAILFSLHSLDLDQPNMRKFFVDMEVELSSIAQAELTDVERLELARSMEEFKDFRECWTQFKAKGLGSSLAAFRNAMALGQLNKDQQVTGLALSTVHTMKGLEKDIVFLIHMCEGIFPDYRAQNPTQIEEEKNAAFVAVTRARRWLYATYPQSRTMPWGGIKAQQRSRFLTQIEN